MSTAAIMLLKRAAASDGGSEALGRAIKSAGLARSVGSGVRKLVKNTAAVGGDLAEGLGASRAAGEVAGVAALGGGTYAAGKKGKRKKDEWMWRHGFAGG